MYDVNLIYVKISKVFVPNIVYMGHGLIRNIYYKNSGNFVWI